MSVIDACICTTFKQSGQTVLAFDNKVLEACQLTQFEYIDETVDVLEQIHNQIGSLVSAHLLESISIVLGLVEVRILLRYDASPDHEDDLDISALQLVRNPPAECQLGFSLKDRAKADFLGLSDLEVFSTSHVQILTA
jgi:hypothetical protein